MNLHEKYMLLCFKLARCGAGFVAPNPMVGAVLVYEDAIIGTGFHRKYGEAHAEVNCINSVTIEHRPFISDSTLYVSLEPCSHTGKTPPCVDFILQHEIKRVVIGCKDLASHVNGKGISKLRENGVEVLENILVEQACELNKRFFTFHQQRRPYILLKLAISADGFISKYHESTKLTSAETDRQTHKWRAEEDAIWIGYQTAYTDNPQLNVRWVHGKNPTRIIFDRNLTLPPMLNIFNNQQPTIVFNTMINRSEGLIEYVKIDEEHFIDEALKTLFQRNILSVIIEGGAKLVSEFIGKNLWDEARFIFTEHLLQDGVKAPLISDSYMSHTYKVNHDIIKVFKNPNLRT